MDRGVWGIMTQQIRLLPELSIKRIETEAIEFIRDTCSGSTQIGLGFSGGKDSVVIMELMKRSRIPFEAFYHATQIDPPEIVKFIRKHHPSVKFIYPRFKFFKKILQHAPPLPSVRWCCAILKHNSKATKYYNPLVLGIRAEESFRRRGYDRQGFNTRQNIVYPILKWTLADVWEYIDLRNLPYCSLYDEGFDRLGCIPCPFKSLHHHQIGQKRWPGVYKAFENTVAKWFYTKKAAGYTMAHDTPEEFLHDWYRGKARWYRGQKP